MPKVAAKKLSPKTKSTLSKVIEQHNEIEQLIPGIHLGISFEDYTKIDAVNCSSLKRVKKSLLHYNTKAPVDDETGALAFGSLCHHGRLEPAELEKRYCILPDWHLDEKNVKANGERSDSKATTYYKEQLKKFREENSGKQEVSKEWIDQMKSMILAIDNHPKAGKLFAKGIPEVTMVWIDDKTGLRCKARIDWVAGITSIMESKTITPSLVDLKTTDDIIGFSLDKYDYHLQAAMYTIGWGVLNKKRVPFHFVAAEKPAPHAVRCAPTSPAAIDAGAQEFRYLLNLVAKAKESGKYPGPTDPKYWELSRWYKPMSFTEHLEG